MYTRKEIFSIPNMLSYLRILLVPVFVYLYLSAETVKDYYVAAITVGISALTDLLDGLIARRCNMITELGKLVDPLADKLTQGALIVCFLGRYSYMFILLGLYVVKESFLIVMGLVLLKHKGKTVDGAKWYGKVSTVVLYAVMLLLLLFPVMSITLVNSTIFVCAVSMFLALIGYAAHFVALYNTAA